MNLKFCCALLGLNIAGSALAVEPNGYSIPYAALSGLYGEPESARDSSGKLGIKLLYGVPIEWPNSALEATVFATSYKRKVDGNSDYSRGVLVNYVYSLALGTLPKSVQVFGLAGLGLIEDDARGRSHINPGINLGGGVLWPLLSKGWALRAELGGMLALADDVIPGEDALLDYHLSVGLQIPLSRFFESPVSGAAPDDCALAVVNVGGGRPDCDADSDRDGVSDHSDLCPGTAAGAQVDHAGCQAGTAPADRDRDGIMDAADACPDTVLNVAVDSRGCAAAQVFVLDGVGFASGSARLTPRSRPVLDQAATTLIAQPTLRIVIAGHTDDRGDSQSNRILSELRADAVRTYLIAQGVSGKRLAARGYGADQPIASNENAAGRALNRRVEFRIIQE